MIISICTLTLLQKPVGGGGVLLLFACCYIHVQTAACMQEHVHVSYYMSTWTPRHHPWSRLPGSLPACCIWHTAWNEGRPLAERVHTGCPETGTRRGSVCGLSSLAVSAWHNNCSILYKLLCIILPYYSMEAWCGMEAMIKAGTLAERTTEAGNINTSTVLYIHIQILLHHMVHWERASYNTAYIRIYNAMPQITVRGTSS